MKVIVFGGSGFLGSHVADVFTDEGYEVTIYDIVRSPYLKKGQKMVIGNVLDKAKVKKAVDDKDYVYNFSGIADINEAMRKPIKAVENNILGNAIILNAARKAKVKRFVFASSLYVYSKTGSFYRTTKQACENLIENYNEVYGLPYTILRYGSLYGPRADENNFIYRIVKQAIEKGVIVRDGDGEELREYIHVIDAARGSVAILGKEFKNQCVIITGNQLLKVKDMLHMVSEILNNKVKVKFRPARNENHYELTPYNFSPKLAKRLVNKAYIDLGQGILDCIQHVYREAKHRNGGKTSAFEE